jgi:micrococcal nuclease
MLLEDIEEGLYRYKARCWRVVDGDTLDLEIDLGMRFSSRQRVRLLGLNTPEVHGVKKDSEEFKKGVDAAKEVAGLLKPNVVSSILQEYIDPEIYDGDQATLWVETIKDKSGKYGRYLANVWVWHNDEVLSLNAHLIKEGLAKNAVY